MIVYVAMIGDSVIAVHRSLRVALIELERAASLPQDVEDRGYVLQWTCAFLDGEPMHLRWTATGRAGESLVVHRARVERDDDEDA